MMTDNEKMRIINSRSPPHSKHTRRQFVGVLAALGLSAALGEALVTYAPWVDYRGEAQKTWGEPFQNAGTLPQQIRELIRYATLAPSGHNAQPWKFAVLGSAIHILPDYSRRLPVVDPRDRELWISLGCALENLVIAAKNAGYTAEIDYPELKKDYLAVHLSASVAQSAEPLFDAIPHRQNTRSLYDGRIIPPADLRKLSSITGSGGEFTLILSSPAQKKAIIEYIKEGNSQQYGNSTYLPELISWLRFNKSEAMHSLDGLYTHCSGNPELPRWLGKFLISSASSGQQNATDEKNLRSSSGMIVIASEQDDQRHWIDTGRLYERLALTMTNCGLKVAFLNQPIEIGPLRAQLQSHLNLGSAHPQLLLRYGYASEMPRSLRRPVEEVLI